MRKSILESFIDKYSLDGVCETAHWYSDAVTNILTAKAHPDSKDVVLKVVLKQWNGVESCQIALPSSTKIRSMLAPLGDEVQLSFNKVRDKVANFTVYDNDCEAICTVAEYDAFEETYDVDLDQKDVPDEFDVEMKLTRGFLDIMMKSINALKDAKDFVLMNNKKGELDMIINYEATNTNRIRIPVETVEGKNKLFVPLGFSAKVFKAIVNANPLPPIPTSPKLKDGEPPPPPVVIPPDPIMKVSSRGIAILKFEDDMFKSTYFMFASRVLE